MLDLTMRDVQIFCSVMAAVTLALKIIDQNRIFGSRNLFGSERVIADLDIAHIGFGALAGVAGVLASRA
jgi:hypothetical protein